MMEAVFISDLHLNPAQPEITERFVAFVQWAAKNTRTLYILGDFFHVWAGDDSLNVWSRSIASLLSGLVAEGVCVFYMHGNRDFLLGERFMSLASIQYLPDPSIIDLNGERILLTHGDRYCTHDRGHQWLRYFTRNRLFSTLFLWLPIRTRTALVSTVRHYSESNARKPSWAMDIVPDVMLADMIKMNTNVVVHGHIHRPGLTTYTRQEDTYHQYVLSDWDDKPKLLCYNQACGFSFV